MGNKDKQKISGRHNYIFEGSAKSKMYDIIRMLLTILVLYLLGRAIFWNK